MTNITSKIISIGSYLPQKILTNFDLEKIIDTTDEWIQSRTGIKKRHVTEDQLTSDLGYLAAKKALEKSNLKAEDIDAIIVATTTPDRTFPSTATIIQNKLGIKNAFAFDVQAVCSGFVYGLDIANNFIKSGNYSNILVIGAENLSKILDWNDRNSCVLFGDGAGAVILSKSDDESGILSSCIYSDGAFGDILQTNGGVSLNQKAGVITMNGKEVFKHAVDKMTSSILESLKLANLTIDDVDHVVSHQANIRILKSVAKKLNLQEGQAIIAVDKHANTSAASIPLALDDYLQNNEIKKGSIIVMNALGAGLTWGSVVVRW
ncbi:ketoacyl-ACP synthase III [Rickettsiales bacterium]|nr:ketoacyl-ACP synthase III [Rickettsiales bacterium]